jgi:hypothetical protein
VSRVAPLLLLLAHALVPLGGPAAAAPIAVQNASFESPAQAAMGDFESVLPPGWALYDPGGIASEDADVGVWWPEGFFDYASGAQDGLQVGYVYVDLPVGTGVLGLRQALPATLQPDHRYSFEAYVGDPTDNSNAGFSGFPGYAVELWAGDDLVARDDDSTTAEGQLRPARATAPVGSVHPGLGAPLEIRLVNANAAAGIEVDFDLVSVDASPAPLETYLFHAEDASGSISGTFVYDRSESAATQPIGSDAAFTITEATGDLAPLAALDFAGGFVSTSGTLLRIGSFAGGDYVQLPFSQSVSLDQPLPLGDFLPENHNAIVQLDNVALVTGSDPAATFELPEPGGVAAAVAALGGLAALGAPRGAFARLLRQVPDRGSRAPRRSSRR